MMDDLWPKPGRLAYQELRDALIDPSCGRRPEDIPEFQVEAKVNDTTPRDFVLAEEGTLNSANGHFLCTDCYIKAGMPSSPGGWVCPCEL